MNEQSITEQHEEEAEATTPEAIQSEPLQSEALQPEEIKPAVPQPPDPRRRLRELLAIPDRDRTDALWDELIELEIQLAPGNRAQAPNADMGRSQKPGRFAEQGRRQESMPGVPRQGNRPGGASNGSPGSLPGAPRPAKRFFKKPRRGPRPPAKV